MSDKKEKSKETKSVGVTRLGIIKRVTDRVLNQLPSSDLEDNEYVTESILKDVNSEMEQLNAVVPKGAQKFKYLDSLLPIQIALIIAKICLVVKLACAGLSQEKDADVLAVYQRSGKDKGLYDTSESTFRAECRKYKYDITEREANEVRAALMEILPRREPCSDRDLIAVNNGIFNFKTKQLMPFTSELVFLSKSKVNYNPNAQNVIIHNDDDGTDWDVESWMDSLSDFPEIITLLWQILGAIIRPLVSWNKSAWFYSTMGNNGKGTLCELMRQLCGESTYASISLEDFGKDFMLEPLMRASAIIVDENNVGTYVDKAANLKAVITGDVIQINRKFKQPISYKFRGFMVQCLNEMPKFKDKTDSFYRRQIFVPFTKCFTGIERKYIKDDYLHRPEVLEYVLYKVLNMNYYELDVPAVCVEALEEFKEYNNPVRRFVIEMLPECRWDFLPKQFLYDLYCEWSKAENASGGVYESQKFVMELRKVVEEHFPGEYEWGRHQGGDRMKSVEYLIRDYDLRAWKDPKFFNYNSMSACIPPDYVRNKQYTGLLKITV
jgi:putative DNA primase/helicase